jgi:hypothetical protein
MSSFLNDPIKLLRQLKGAPLAVLLAFAWSGSRLSADYLVTVTGYTDKPVTQALKVLNAYGWIVKVQGGWQIAGGVQLPLMFEESEKFRSSSSSSSKEVEINISEDEQENRKNSDSYLVNFRTLKGYGIREPALSRLAGLKHVTPALVNAHVRQVFREKGTLGTAIHRIENDWLAPEIIEEVKADGRYSNSLFLVNGTNMRNESEEQ